MPANRVAGHVTKLVILSAKGSLVSLILYSNSLLITDLLLDRGSSSNVSSLKENFLNQFCAISNYVLFKCLANISNSLCRFSAEFELVQ